MFSPVQKSMIEIFADSAVEMIAKKEGRSIESVKLEALEGGSLAERIMSIVLKTCAMPTEDFKQLTGI